MWSQTKFTDLLDIRYPIVQGPFGGGYSSVELTSTVSNLGGMGSFGAQHLTPQQILDVNAEIRAHTDKPYAINLWIDDRDKRLETYGQEEYSKLQAIFKPYFDALKIPVPDMPQDLGPRFKDQIGALLDAKPPAFSFVYGIPSSDILEACRKRGIKTIGTATTVDEAVALDEAGVDGIVATGFEAGGHRVSFLKPAEDSLMGIFSLIPQVADRVRVPVIAAGGIADARGLKAALILGADAAQIGTAFLATAQSNATPAHRDQLFSSESKYTVLTKVFSGRLARGIRSKLSEAFKDQQHLMAPFPMQSRFLKSLRAALVDDHKADHVSFWSGQSAPLISHKDATGFFQSLVNELDSSNFMK